MHYTSRMTLLGWPLVHLAIASRSPDEMSRGIARGWIALGDVANGAIAIGGVAVGGVAIGGLSAGVLSLGGLALGVWALGGGAVGVLACGGAAIALRAALGGFAIATQYAIGGAAIADRANDEVALAFFQQSAFFSAANWLILHSRWLSLLVLLPILGSAFQRFKKH